MRGLVSKALTGNEMLDEHSVRDNLYDGDSCDMMDYSEIFERATERAKIIDPDGSRALYILKQLQTGEI